MFHWTKAFIITFILVNLSACSAFTEISSSASSTADAVTPDITINEFVNKRYLAIRQDAANGGGEDLDALAQLLGKKDKLAFAQGVKRNFDYIFKGVQVPSDIIARIESQVISKNG